jgi:type VI protein secretion system component Hcp
MPLDGFLEIKPGGAPSVTGETRDAAFAGKGAMSINSFEFGSESGSGGSGEEQGKTGKGQTKQLPPPKSPPPPRRPPTPPGPPTPPSDPLTALYFYIKKDVDLATPDLFLAYCQNHRGDAKPFESARVTLRRAGGRGPQIYLVVEFQEVFVTAYEIQGGSKDELPEESVTFSFKKMVTVDYTPQGSEGQGHVARHGEFKLGTRPK